MKYSIVIPTYNHCSDLLKPCIDSIIKYSDLESIELIVIANGCTDETSSYLTYLHDFYRVKGLSSNFKSYFETVPLGYSKATNIGIRLATTDKIVLLNNDTVLLEQQKNYWLEMLERPMVVNQKCGISCVVKAFSEAANHDFAIFFCVMIHRKVFDAIGLLNEDYGKGAGEDTEFCIEAERAGFEVLECCAKNPDPDGKYYTGAFPMYHLAEGTVHDTSLVPDWADVFKENTKRLAEKYNPAWFSNKKENDPKTDLAWLEASHPSIFKEMVTDNSYHIDYDMMRNREVIDIGANVGCFSVLAGYYGAKKVVSVEPVSQTYRTLQSNIERSGYNITAFNNVVTDIPGQVVRMSVKDDSGHNSRFNITDNYEEISSITLEQIIKNFESNNIFLKIDCEGSEYDILLNARKEDMDRINHIVMEMHTDLHPVYKGKQILNDKLKEFGFTLIKEDQIYSWFLNEKGEQYDVKEIPFVQQIWRKQ